MKLCKYVPIYFIFLYVIPSIHDGGNEINLTKIVCIFMHTDLKSLLLI